MLAVVFVLFLIYYQSNVAMGDLITKKSTSAAFSANSS